MYFSQSIFTKSDKVEDGKNQLSSDDEKKISMNDSKKLDSNNFRKLTASAKTEWDSMVLH